jgi:hypothetical protein
MASEEILAGIQQWDTRPEAMGSGAEIVVSVIRSKKSSKIIASIQWDTGPTASGEILAGIQ